jgi:hypothetical protein
VIRSKFRPSRKTFWTPGFKHLRPLAQNLVEYEYQPSFAKLLKLVPAAYLS